MLTMTTKATPGAMAPQLIAAQRGAFFSPGASLDIVDPSCDARGGPCDKDVKQRARQDRDILAKADPRQVFEVAGDLVRHDHLDVIALLVFSLFQQARLVAVFQGGEVGQARGNNAVNRRVVLPELLHIA